MFDWTIQFCGYIICHWLSVFYSTALSPSILPKNMSCLLRNSKYRPPIKIFFTMFFTNMTPFQKPNISDEFLFSTPIPFFDWYFSWSTRAMRLSGLMTSFHHHFVNKAMFILSNLLIPSPILFPCIMSLNSTFDPLHIFLITSYRFLMVL